MNILQTIIQKLPSNLLEKNTNPVFVDKIADEGVPIYTDTLMPSTETFLTGVPRETMEISFTDKCCDIYSHVLTFEHIVGSIWEHIKGIFIYRQEIKCAKELAKMEKDRRALFVMHQVQAMRQHVADFNLYNSVWAEGESKLGTYRIRNNHNMITNRNISRHWNTNAQQSVIA